MKKTYEAIACLPDGTTADRLEFEYDVAEHESFRHVRWPDPYLAVDAPGVVEFVNRWIPPGYIQIAVTGLEGDSAVYCVDESGIAKHLPHNAHPLAQPYEATRAGNPPLLGLLGPVVVIRAKAEASVAVPEAMPKGRPELQCIGCGKSPSEIGEYIVSGAENGMTPDDYVWEEEGTLNRANGHFACTECYIEMGMPTGVGRRWVAP